VQRRAILSFTPHVARENLGPARIPTTTPAELKAMLRTKKGV